MNDDTQGAPQKNHSVYLALGSNLGDREAHLEAAIAALAPQVRVTARSHIYQTPPWGYEQQDDFLNMAVQGETQLAPEELLAALKDIEKQLGRVKRFRNGPREIDLDILFYDDQVYESPQLTIPHPRLHERGFVLMPLADIAPDLVHPHLGKTIGELLAGIDTSDIQPFGDE